MAAESSLPPPGAERRRLLRALVATPLLIVVPAYSTAACTGSKSPPGPSGPPGHSGPSGLTESSTGTGPPVDVDGPAVELAAVQVRALLAALIATGTRHASLVSPLLAFRRRHEAHLAVLGPVASSGAASSGAATGAVVPADVRAALAALAARERSAAVAVLGVLLPTSPPVARVLASFAACCAVHAELLSNVTSPSTSSPSGSTSSTWGATNSASPR